MKKKIGRMKLNCKERMQLKAWICLLGILFLLFITAGKLYVLLRTGEEMPKSVPAEAVMKKLSNVWIIEVGEDNLLLYRDGQEESYDYGAVEVAVSGKGEILWELPLREAEKTELHLYQPDKACREQLADVILTDGRVTAVYAKTEKIHGNILSADENFIELEGYGMLPLAENYRGYRIFNTLAMCTYADLAFGYDFADLVLEEGEVCGILMVREKTMDAIRVLIKTSDFQEMLHDEIQLTSDTNFRITYGSVRQEITEEYTAGTVVTINLSCDYFFGDRIVVKPTVLTGKIFLQNVSRSQGVPGYRGHIELIREKEKIAVINDVLLEEYLYSVVPSEMPASYPGEALKAQAICARTYAYGHMQHAAFPAYGAHVDDSTSYQVYNNILENETTTKAVKETYGQLLWTEGGTLAETYYYSTSCGVGSDAGVWKTDAAEKMDYLRAGAISETAMEEKLTIKKQQNGQKQQSVQEGSNVDLGEYLRKEEHFKEFITGYGKEDFESEEGWYRWSYSVKKLNAEYICEVLKKRYNASPGLILTLDKKGNYTSREVKDFTQIHELFIGSRERGGVADELLLETDNGTYKVISEHNIRYVLCDGQTQVVRQNGSKVEMPNLLPSGFFVIESVKKNGNVVSYVLVGGGFGHGVGMSQNGAAAMAKKGYSCEEILLFFYEGCRVETIY